MENDNTRERRKNNFLEKLSKSSFNLDKKNKTYDAGYTGEVRKFNTEWQFRK
jgi:hypothetical protein